MFISWKLNIFQSQEFWLKMWLYLSRLRPIIQYCQHRFPCFPISNFKFQKENIRIFLNPQTIKRMWWTCSKKVIKKRVILQWKSAVAVASADNNKKVTIWSNDKMWSVLLLVLEKFCHFIFSLETQSSPGLFVFFFFSYVICLIFN